MCMLQMGSFVTGLDRAWAGVTQDFSSLVRVVCVSVDIHMCMFLMI